MAFYEERMQALQQQISRKRRLEATLSDLHAQRRDLVTKVEELEACKWKEQADVDRLEGGSLAAFFYSVIGKMGEKLTKEREEAYAAAVKYDVAVKELAFVEEDIQRYTAELDGLAGCEARYEQVLEEKSAAIKAAGGAEAAEITHMEERILYLEHQQRELCEAITAGEEALTTADEVLSSLDSAEGWGVFDLMGGGLLADLAKHSHLDEAQGAVEHLQMQLRRFKTELADVTIRADLQVSIDGFLQFADFFFDGLFADWAVMDQISQSQNQVKDTRDQIVDVLNRLSEMLDEAKREQEQAEGELDDRIRRTPV